MLEWIHSPLPLFVSMWKDLLISPNLAYPHVGGWGKGILKESRLGTKPFSTLPRPLSLWWAKDLGIGLSIFLPQAFPM
jgi:hypothetical protein